MAKRLCHDNIYRLYLLETRFEALIELLKEENPELIKKYESPEIFEKCIESAGAKLKDTLEVLEN